MLHWHDAALEGFAEYESPKRVHRFKLLSNPLETPKFFLLTTTKLETLDEFVAILRSLGAPHWPIWIPNWRFPTKQEEARANVAIESLGSEQPSATVLQANRINDAPQALRLLRDVSEHQNIAQMSARHATNQEWRALMAASIQGP